jgi:phosphate-selective porin
MLTGENRQYDKFGQHGAQFARFVPDETVYFTKDGVSLGAWEARARYSNLNLRNVTKGEYNDITLGMNWYWSDRVRIMFDYIHPVTTSGTPFGATTSDILGIRFDWNW